MHTSSWTHIFFISTIALSLQITSVFTTSYPEDCLNGRTLPQRTHSVSISEFGAVGDGIKLNTKAFQEAIAYLRSFSSSGGSQLNITRGIWLTGSFNLTSNFTLYLEKDAVVLGSQDPEDWPVIDPLPSYGRGRERPGGRYISLIHGENLTDVVITGDNGTIDGQGSVWWEMWYNRTLKYTRGHLVEFMSSEKIIISNIVLRNSPFWNIHPVYCSDVIIKGVSIFAPSTAPNTDGIDPDSSTNVCVEDCYISNGDDLISLKSGWDEYGIAMGRPTENVIIRRIMGTTPFSGIAIGSEMSGGVNNVYVTDIHLFGTGTGIRLKTAPGRGGYIRNITISGMTMENVEKAIDITANAGEHPDTNFDPDVLPLVSGVVIENIVGHGVLLAGRLLGLEASPLLNICLLNIFLNVSQPSAWLCSYVEGVASSVYPLMCPKLNTSEDQLCGNFNSLLPSRI